MKSYKHLYPKVFCIRNLVLAWRKARKYKTKKDYVLEFEANLRENLLKLHEELKRGTYSPLPLKTFVLRDPKTRVISKSAFRDRIVHHAIINVLEPIFEKIFIYDSCANRKGKGNLFAIKRFDKFKRKVSENGLLASGVFDDNYVKGYCLKADIRHYFQEVNHEVLLNIIRRKIDDEIAIDLVRKILINGQNKKGIGMPLGNLTSQFFANVYLNEFDYFIKHELKVRYYLRYVDDFVILHHSKAQLEEWKQKINEFLNNELKIELHPEKSKVIPLSKGIDFVGFRNFYCFKLLRKRNILKMKSKIADFYEGNLSMSRILKSFQGWNAYAKWANCYNMRKNLAENLISNQKDSIS